MTSLHYGLDATLLSAPGSPYAFSTALKPPGALRRAKGIESDVVSRLSLGSVGSNTPPLLLPSNDAANNDRKLQSPNETGLSESLGILDLDAMEDSGVSQFLSSPNGDGLQLRLSVATSARSSNIPPSNQIMPTLHPSPSNQMMPTLHPPSSNQAPVFNPPFDQMISAAPPLSSELDESGSSEGELALSAGDLAQLDVTLTDESDHSFTQLPGQHTLSDSKTNGHYNPFEDYDPGSFGGEDFEAQQDQASFLHELEQQEEKINKATLTPSDSRLTSFTSACPQSDFSLHSYFNKKSNQMGQLSEELSPSQRPLFNDTPSHVIVSPTATDTTPKESSSIVFDGLTPALSSHSTPPPTPPRLDLSEQTSLDQGLPSMYFHNELPPSNQNTPTDNSVSGLPSQYLQMEQPPSNENTPTGNSVSGLPSQYLQMEQPPSNENTPTGNSVGGLPSQYLQMEQSPSNENTPTGNAVSALPSQYLQMEQPPSNENTPTGNAVSALPSQYLQMEQPPCNESTPTGNSAGGLKSQYLRMEQPPSDKNTPTGNSVDGLPSQYLQMEQLSLKDTPYHPETSQSLRLSPQYLQPEDSTLVFPELSAISSLPPEAPYSLATPASAYLPLGFEVTSIGNQPSFTTTATDESITTITVDTSHVTSEKDNVISHGSPINTNLSSVSTTISGSCEQSHQVMAPNGSLDIDALLRSQPLGDSPDISITTSPPPPPHSNHTPPQTVHTTSTVHTTAAHHSPSPKRPPVARIPPEWLEVCQSLEFDSVVCVGSSQCQWMDVSNRGDRWIQVSLLVAHLTRDEQEVSTDAVFTLTQRLFVGPGCKERVKVTFAPVAEGVYNGVVSLQGSLVVSSAEEPLATVKLCGCAEAPRLTIPSSQSLDYGTVVGGSVVRLPLELSNAGSSLLPLKITINCNDPLHRMYFTVADACQTSPPSPRAHPHSVTLSLPPHPHNKPHPLHIELSAPKFYHSDTTRPPLEIQGSLDIALDSVHATHSVTSLPIRAVVGVAKLLAPGSFQGNDFTLSCLVGQTKTERVPLKNAGNIPLSVTAKTSHPTLFLLSPHTLTIQPGQESYVDVTFVPISDPVTSEMTLQLHVNPSGPDYNLNVRGVAIPASKQRTVSWNNKTLQSMSGSPKTKQISQWLSEVPSLSSHPTHTSQPSHPSHSTPPSQLSYPTPPSHSSPPLQPSHHTHPSQPSHSSPPLQPSHHTPPSQTSHPTPHYSQPSHHTPPSQPSHHTPPSQPSHPTSHYLQPSHHTQPSHPTPQYSQPSQENAHRRSVYIREEEVLFPPTPLNTRSTVKVQVCNRDLPLAVFTVLKPALPFTVDHRSFKLGSRQCARLPIHFTPAMPGKYSGIVALRTDSKHQMFVVVRGESHKP